MDSIWILEHGFYMDSIWILEHGFYMDLKSMDYVWIVQFYRVHVHRVNEDIRRFHGSRYLTYREYKGFYQCKTTFIK